MDIGYILAFVSILVWGLVVIPVKAAGTGGHIGVVVSMVAGIGALFGAMLFGAVAPVEFSAITPRVGLSLLLSGICQFPLATLLYYEAIRRADISEAIPATRLKTVFVIILAASLGLDRVTASAIIATLLGIAGICALTYRRKDPLAPPTRSNGVGLLLALLAALSWALGDVLIRVALQELPATSATLLSLACGAAAYLLFMAVTRRLGHVVRMPRRDKLLYATHGVLSFGVGYLAFYASMQDIGLANASILTSTWPAVSFVVGIVLYRERLSVMKITGFGLLMASMFLIIKR